MWSPLQAVIAHTAQSCKTSLCQLSLFQRAFSHTICARTAPTFHSNRFVAGDNVAANTQYTPMHLATSPGHRSLLLTSSPAPLMTQMRGYKAVLKPRLICSGCYFVWRHGRKHVECSDLPRHKQMKKLVKRKIWKEDYSKGNIQKAMNWFRVEPRRCARTVDRTAMSQNWVAGRIGTEI